MRRLLGNGDKTEDNPGTFENVDVAHGPELDACSVGQVLVCVKAACINYPDLLQTVGGYQHKPKLPFIPGQEVYQGSPELKILQGSSPMNLTTLEAC